MKSASKGQIVVYIEVKCEWSGSMQLETPKYVRQSLVGCHRDHLYGCTRLSLAHGMGYWAVPHYLVRHLN